MTKKLTLKDIAEKAGVSLTTASMYINGKAEKYKIAKATCERIEAVIQKHNFNPNIHARAIAGKKTFLIGVIIPDDINKSFWFDIISGIESTLARHNYHMIMAGSHQDAQQELATYKFMKSKSVDGIIIAPNLTPDANNLPFLKQESKALPLVAITNNIEGLPSIYNCEQHGGELAADYLLKKGHRQIAYIGSGNQYQSRCHHFQARLKANSIDATCFHTPDEFMEQAGDYTAVFCFSDFTAMELCNKAADANLKIPDDLSIIGYDNMDFLQYLRPRLTTIHQHKQDLGEAAALAVLEAIKADTKPLKGKSFIPKLIIGNSVKQLA